MSASPAGPRVPLGTVVLGAVIMASAAGLVLVALGPWRAGAATLGGSLVLGSFARTLLPERHAGLLRVRRASADVVAMTALGVSMVALALLVPDQPRL